MLFPKHIQSLAPYQPGKPISELAREFNLPPSSIIKLASNENPLGISPKAKVAILQGVEDLARYPDGGAYAFRQAIAQKFMLAPEQIIPGNGSDNLLELIAKSVLTHEHSAVVSQYAFSIYNLVTQECGAQVVTVPAKDYAHDSVAMLAGVRDNTKLLFIANPNNPTGTLMPPDELYSMIDRVPRSVLVVLDEAYTDFLPIHLRSDSLAWVHKFEHLIVCRSFSKSHGLAGIRAGFAACHPDYARTIQNIRLSFNVNSLAQAAVVAALDDDDFLQATYENNQRGMSDLADGFGKLGLSFIPSHANFITFHHPKAQEIHHHLLQHGIIVRPVAGYGMPESLRVSVGLPHENKRLLETLAHILKEPEYQTY